MVALWIIGGLVLLFFLLGLVRVQVQAVFGEPLRVTVQIGPCRRQLLPPPDKPPQKPKKKTPKKVSGPKESPGAARKLTPEELRSLLSAAGRGLAGMSRSFRRHVSVTPLTLSIITGGDPADAARLYGYLNGAVFTGMPLLEQRFHIPDPHIHLDIDYCADKTRVEGTVGIRLRIRDGIRIGMALTKPLLHWFLQWRRARRSSAPAPQENDRTKESRIA